MIVQNAKIHIEVCLMFRTKYMLHLWKSHLNCLAVYIWLPTSCGKLGQITASTGFCV